MLHGEHPLSAYEYAEWVALYRIEHEEAKKAHEQAKNRQRRR